MLSKDFITKTLTFIANSIFINIFSKIFGMSNTIVAVSIVVIALTLVMIDLKEDIFRKTFLISMAIMLLGIGATVSAMNPVIGLIVNIVIIFAIVYQTVDNYKSPMYFPFLISYIFMLMSAPATYEELPLRIVSIIVGSLYILLIQLVLNKDRFKKTIFGTRKGIVFNIIQQIDNILDMEYDNKINHQVDGLINTVVTSIHHTKSKNKYITEKNKGNLEIALSLQNLNKSLRDFEDINTLNDDMKNCLIKVKKILGLVDEYFYHHNKKSNIIEDINIYIDEISQYRENKEINNIIKAINGIPIYLQLTEKHTDKSMWKKDLIIKNVVKKIDNIDSLEFKFALKMSLSVSLVIFLTNILNLTYGRWIIFPMISIIQPYYDETMTKAKNRVIGTIIGIILFTIIFSIVEDPAIRMNITIISAYIGLFITKYEYSTAIVAISALGSSAMRGGGIEILFWRIIFTIIGCIVAMLVNKYILHYRVSHSIEDLSSEYQRAVNKLNSINITKENETKIYNLKLNIKLMEHKLSGKSRGIK
ncbi:MAG: FUSC family protein [Romboutsia sp.]